MTAALLAAALSSLCFGIALITSRIGLHTIDARRGAAISIPTATALFALAAPFAFDARGFTLQAALWFALVGLFFPASVTLLTFRSNQALGPTVTGAVSGTAPLFARLAAALLLGETIPAEATVAAAGIGVGVALMSCKRGGARHGPLGWALLWPVAGAVVRGFAQAAAKAGLLLWPNPFAAGLIGYSVSCVTVLAADRLERAARRKRTQRGIAWFALTGVLNGSAVLLMYAALSVAPVSLVAPVVATYPLVTALASALLLRDEPLTRGIVAGATLTVLAVVYLVGSGTGA